MVVSGENARLSPPFGPRTSGSGSRIRTLEPRETERVRKDGFLEAVGSVYEPSYLRFASTSRLGRWLNGIRKEVMTNTQYRFHVEVLGARQTFE